MLFDVIPSPGDRLNFFLNYINKNKQFIEYEEKNSMDTESLIEFFENWSKHVEEKNKYLEQLAKYYKETDYHLFLTSEVTWENVEKHILHDSAYDDKLNKYSKQFQFVHDQTQAPHLLSPSSAFHPIKADNHEAIERIKYDLSLLKNWLDQLIESGYLTSEKYNRKVETKKLDEKIFQLSLESFTDPTHEEKNLLTAVDSWLAYFETILKKIEHLNDLTKPNEVIKEKKELNSLPDIPHHELTL